MKVGVYTIGGGALWLSLLIEASSILMPAILLTVTAACYLIAVLRKEDASKSSLITQEAVARSVISRV